MDDPNVLVLSNRLRHATGPTYLLLRGSCVVVWLTSRGKLLRLKPGGAIPHPSAFSPKITMRGPIGI